ncbi:5116_t:CDS:2, partial [Cetraspora pellucida]
DHLKVIISALKLSKLTVKETLFLKTCSNTARRNDPNNVSQYLQDSISAESCRYRRTLFGSFHHAVFEHVFKNKVSPTVNSESSEADIMTWKSSNE